LDLLAAQNHDVHTVSDENLTGRSDDVVFEAAAAEVRILITQDLDFSDVRRFRPGTHPGIVLLRLRDPNRRKLIARMEQIIRDHNIELWSRRFVVIGDIRLRIIHP
jgi:predicted nuclease of predicted toxin-antitoxin system